MPTFECPRCGKTGVTSKAVEPGSNVRCPECRERFVVGTSPLVGLIDTGPRPPSAEFANADSGPSASVVRAGEGPRLAELTAEIEALKRSHRRLRIQSVAGVILASFIGMLPGLLASRPSFQQLPANLATLDPDGSLAVPRLVIRDQLGENRAVLDYGERGTAALRLYSKGKVRGEFAVGRIAGVDLDKPERTGTSSLSLTGDKGTEFSVRGGDYPGLSIRDPNGQQRVMITASDGGAHMAFDAPNRETKLQFGVIGEAPHMDFFEPGKRVKNFVGLNGEVLVPLPGQ